MNFSIKSNTPYLWVFVWLGTFFGHVYFFQWISNCLFSLRSKIHFLCVTFFSAYYETVNSFMNPLFSFTNTLLWQWYVVAFTEHRCLFDKCGFLLTQYCEHKRTKSVFYWIAGGVYLSSSGNNSWSVVLFSNPLVTITLSQCLLLIRELIYQSAEKNLNGKNRQKKGPKPNLFLLVHLSTITQNV